MASRTPAVDKLYTSGEIYPQYLPDFVKNELMKHHRIANAQIFPRPQLHLEIQRLYRYNIGYDKEWEKDNNLRPSFICELYRLEKIVGYLYPSDTPFPLDLFL